VGPEAAERIARHVDPSLRNYGRLGAQPRSIRRSIRLGAAPQLDAADHDDDNAAVLFAAALTHCIHHILANMMGNGLSFCVFRCC
jgi:hypothetical protein